MEITFPKYLENILNRYLKQTFYASTNREVFSNREFNAQDLKFFAQGAALLSEFFTSERKELPLNYLNDKKLRAGYLLYFFPLNFCKAQAALQKLPPSLFKKSRLKILDLGCGPGTASLAAVDYLTRLEGSSKKQPVQIEILCLDQNYHILKDAQAFHEEMAKNIKERGYPLKSSIISRTFDLRRGKPDTLLKNDQYDLIMAANFFNEWPGTALEEKARFLEKICDRHLAEEGYLILLDPALQKTSRELMALRDVLLKRKSLHIYAPCLHQKDCPMLAATDRDWCHFYIDWQEPAFMKQLDRLLKNKNEFLKYSFVIFSSKPKSEIDFISMKKDHPPVQRVISNLMGSRGKSELVVCGPSGRWRMTRLDKHASPKNKSLAVVKRGDLVFIPKIPQKPFQNNGHLKIEKEDVVDKI